MYNRVLDRRTIWVILFAGILLAGSVMLMSLYDSTFAQDAAIEYAENGTGPVATYTAVDPEQTAIVSWTLSGDDAGLFSIEGGVLEFKKSPDFEDAKDDGGDNMHSVTVQATDSTNKVGTKKVSVEVTNVEELGKVTLSALRPQSSVMLTATPHPVTLTAAYQALTWQWAKAGSRNGAYAVTSTDADIKQLRAG